MIWSFDWGSAWTR
jgi:methionyl-tRNA formyltransferase